MGIWTAWNSTFFDVLITHLWLTLSLSNEENLSLSPPPPPLSLSHTHTSLSLSLTHTHTHTHICMYARTHAYNHTEANTDPQAKTMHAQTTHRHFHLFTQTHHVSTFESDDFSIAGLGKTFVAVLGGEGPTDIETTQQETYPLATRIL